jgi:hypothetical protein
MRRLPALVLLAMAVALGALLFAASYRRAVLQPRLDVIDD